MSTAFVLSGGSNLGATQVGMLRALFEAGIVPDSITGTSAGAINALGIAQNPSLDGVRDLERIWLSLKRSTIFPFKPVHGFLGFIGRRDSLVVSDGLRQVLSSNLRITNLEDAQIPLAVVATEVRTGSERVFRSGPALESVLASAAIPGIFPPVHIDGVAYMDGGVADHTPISTPANDGADEVFVLSAGSSCALTRLPRSTVGVASQALSVLVQRRVWQDISRYSGECRLHIVPPMCPVSVGPLDFSQSRDLIESAYASTRSWLERGAPSAADLLQPHSH